MFSCFAGGRMVSTPMRRSSESVNNIGSAKELQDELADAHTAGHLVAIEWAAAWFSLSLQADHIFASLALRHSGKPMRFLRVDLDKIDGVEPGLSVLPSFSVYLGGVLVEQFIGLESAKELAARLELSDPRWSLQPSPLESAGATPFSAAAESQLSEDSSETHGAVVGHESHSRSSSWSSVPQLCLPISPKAGTNGGVLEERLSLERGLTTSLCSTESIAEYQPRYIRRCLQERYPEAFTC